MSGVLTIAWGARSEDRSRHLFHQLSVAAAALLVSASTAATILEQSSPGETSVRSERGAAPGSAALPGREVLVAAYTGVPYTYPSRVRIGREGDAITIDPVQWYTDPFDNPIYYGARVARWGARAGMMLDFIHSKAMARLGEGASFEGAIDGKPLPTRSRISDIVKKLEFSHGHNMLLLTGLLRLPGIGARLSPYVGAGAGALLPHTEVELAAEGRPRTYEYNFAGPAAQAIAGVEIRLSRLSLFIEYKFTYGHYGAPLSQMDGSWMFLDLWRQMKRWVDGVPPPGGHVETEIVSHQVVGGLAVRFAARP